MVHQANERSVAPYSKQRQHRRLYGERDKLKERAASPLHLSR